MDDDDVVEYYEREVARLDEEAARFDALFWQEVQDEVCAKQCNQHMHYCKGTTREPRDRAADKRFVIDDSLSDYEKVTKLADLITKASEDGARLEVKIKGAPWGDTLILASGREDPRQKAGAHGVKHALEERHYISALEIAETLLTGTLYPDKSIGHRVNMYKYPYLVVLEKEIQMSSGRMNKSTAKLHTAEKNASYHPTRKGDS